MNGAPQTPPTTDPMTYGSVCSGIEAATVAWRPLGWRAAFFAEIDAFPCALLTRHYPDVPNLGDMTRFKEWPDATLDVLVGGTPCQPFSIAGLRKGLADPRGGLTLTFLEIAARYRPRWILWENVPGVLSQDGGWAFGSFLGGLEELGYGWAYRVLDAQYFGVPQRRRRVFVVASARGWAAAAAVLFERESLSGHPAPSRAARKDVAGAITSSLGNRGHGSDRGDGAHLIARHVSTRGGQRLDLESETLLAFDTTQITHPENRSRPDDRAPQLAATAHAPTIAFHARQDPDSGDVTHPLDTDGTSIGVAFQCSQSGERMHDVAPTLDCNWGSRRRAGIVQTAVRRLTPRECERLQGFPDDYTLIPYKGEPAKDAPRYKALGNSMCTRVMRWLGERIELVESVAHEMEAAA